VASKPKPINSSEEMSAEGEIQIGDYISPKGSARVTSAGLICAGIAGVTILLAAAIVARAARR
jgi:hypothetical protein